MLHLVIVVVVFRLLCSLGDAIIASLSLGNMVPSERNKGRRRHRAFYGLEKLDRGQ